MNWQNFFQLKVMQKIGTREVPYFHDVLKVGGDFTLSELHLREFMDLRLSERELKKFSLTHRKIFLRLEAFQSREFRRIADNFVSRILGEREKVLSFETSAGGVYLFCHLLNYRDELAQKKIYCRTSEIPFGYRSIPPSPSLRLEYHPRPSSVFDPFPALWQDSPQLALFEVDETRTKTA